MSLDIEKMNRIRQRANRSLRVMQLMWLPLLIVYGAWLVALGYDACRWYGAIMAVMVGTGYPFAIAISLSARQTGPQPFLEDAKPAAPAPAPAPTDRCVFCGADNVVIAKCCNRAVCPTHRIGTGTVSDGFDCPNHPFCV
jgi:hypothetical protein